MLTIILGFKSLFKAHIASAGSSGHLHFYDADASSLWAHQKNSEEGHSKLVGPSAYALIQFHSEGKGTN